MGKPPLPSSASFVELSMASVDINEVSRLFMIGYARIKTVLFVGIMVFW
jgi:hypothetical protein